MSTVTLSPNMNLPVPVVGQDPGPDWANNINSSLGILDQHDHTAGKGIQIVPSAININSDLPFNSNNATLLKSSRYISNNAPLSAVSPNLQCLYVSGVDLYYNDGNGNQIRITSAGAVTGAAGTITGLPSGTASAVYSAIQGTFVFQQATNTAAAMDFGSVIMRYAGSYPVPSGNYIMLQAPSTLATGYAFTLPTALPASNNSFTVTSTAGAQSYVNTDNTTLTVNGSTLQVYSGPSTVNMSLLADGAGNATWGYSSWQSQAFNSAGTFTFTVPTGVNLLFASVRGGSGGGSYGVFSPVNGNCGGGGGAGAASVLINFSVNPGDLLTVIVGAAGTGGTSGSPNGGKGGNTQIKRGVTVLGGAQGAPGGYYTFLTGQGQIYQGVSYGGQGGSGGNGGFGGFGGLVSPATNPVNATNGLNSVFAVGGPGGNLSNSSGGGGGGGDFQGTGGAGGVSGQAGTAGTAGGGGGGGGLGANGGAGTAGQVTLYWKV